MPAVHREDAASLDPVAVALDRSGVAALDASHELLAHYSDTGERPTQRAVNTLIDHAADTLRALTDSIEEIQSELAELTELAELAELAASRPRREH